MKIRNKKLRFLNLISIAAAILAILIAFFAGKHAAANPNGTYEFGEYMPPDKTWAYVVTLKRGNAHVVITTSTDKKDINAKVVKDGKGFDVVFDSYNDESSEKEFKAGDTLFAFYPVDAGMLVEWDAMKPQLEENTSGRVFTKMD